MKQLREVLVVSPVDQTVIDLALQSGWKDFEDAVQNFAAKVDPSVTAIITRNTKDFRYSDLEVVDSIDFL